MCSASSQTLSCARCAPELHIASSCTLLACSSQFAASVKLPCCICKAAFDSARCVMQVLDDLQTDPKNSQHHLQHPQIRANIEKLVSAGLVQMR